MTIPTAPLYPDSFDNENNLFTVADGLRLTLFADYNPGDTKIQVQGDLTILSKWPNTGILTLNEGCSDVNERSISFYYSGVNTTTGEISNLQLASGFIDRFKPKNYTNVVQNVFDQHHNSLKDTIIAIEEFIGVKGTTDTQPSGATLEGRVNFLRNIALQPKAWFQADVRFGNVPLEVEFTNLSFRLATDNSNIPITTIWDFGDHVGPTSMIISATSTVPDSPTDVLVYDIDNGKIKKTYFSPGIYDVSLTVTNEFGSDTCVFPKLINAKIHAPNEATIDFSATSTQKYTPGIHQPNIPYGPYTVKPTIRSPINTLIKIGIIEDANGNFYQYTDNNQTYATSGTLLNNSLSPIDPIKYYTWNISDDLNHPNSPTTNASFSVGGIYDLKLRVDTEFGSYRITTYNQVIDIVEQYNLWLWIFQQQNNIDTNLVQAYEYGLLSESFKLNSTQTYTVYRNSNFLENTTNADQKIREFNTNTGLSPVNLTTSGNGGYILLYWASGRDASASDTTESINFVQYNGFTDVYSPQASIYRPWNWTSFASVSTAYFLFGSALQTGQSNVNNYSFTNSSLTSYDLGTSFTSSTDFVASNFLNGAQELQQNVGGSSAGGFSVYRSAWKDSTGYIARNDGVNSYFRIKSFYRAEGTIGTPVQNIRKLTDIQGTTKTEGKLTNLSQGIYFFNNSGSVSAFNDSSNTWTVGGPGVNSVAYSSLQDTTVPTYSDQSNTLLVASDSNYQAYLSFDYSSNVFLKFNEITATFSLLGARSAGTQWMMGIY